MMVGGEAGHASVGENFKPGEINHSGVEVENGITMEVSELE